MHKFLFFEKQFFGALKNFFEPQKHYLALKRILDLEISKTMSQIKDYISGCDDFSLNSQSVSFLQAYLLLELISSALLAGGPADRRTGGKCPLVLSK